MIYAAMQHTRYYAALVLIAICLVYFIFSRHPIFIHWMIGLLGALPAIFLAFGYFAQGRAVAKNSTGFALIVSAFLVGWLAFFSQPIAALANGYPNPWLDVPLLWGLAGIAFLIAPIGLARPSWFASGTIVGAILFFAVFWAGLSVFISNKAEAIAASDQWCIRETDGSTLQRSWWFSPRKMLLQNDYKGVTLTYLRLSLDGAKWTHHWSFKRMMFLQDEAAAFGFTRSFWPPEQTDRTCVVG